MKEWIQFCENCGRKGIVYYEEEYKQRDKIKFVYKELEKLGWVKMNKVELFYHHFLCPKCK